MAKSNPPWDVNKYKSDFESEEQWQLRKTFMLTHMDKFSEDRLVCLARVFFNIEFMGCRYPEQTMRMVEELSKGVADDHREKQQQKLKRIFVKASDAAGDRIKGAGEQPPREPPNNIAREGIGFCSSHTNLTKPLPDPLSTGDFPGLILFENRNKKGNLQTCPIYILMTSTQMCKKLNSITFSRGRNCELKINDKLVATAKGSTINEARLNAAIKGLNILRKTYYTIQAKQNFIGDGPAITKDGKAAESNNPLSQDNIGFKIMRKMGWSGGGLGKSQQGIQDPIQAGPQIMKRSGFGNANQREFGAKFRKCFKDYLKSDSNNDLVFSPDFTVEERVVLNRLAQSFNLKTQTYGKVSERYLVVSKQMQLPELLQQLLACGGENEKYLLIPPGGHDADRYPENTMRMVEELSKGVADDHREKQKGKLKSTFVKDAAGARIKGAGEQSPIEPPNIIAREGIGFCSIHTNLTKPLPDSLSTGDFPGLILFETFSRTGKLKNSSINILMTSTQKCKKLNSITFSRDRNCELKINNKLVATAEGRTIKEARLNAAIKGLNILRKTCYTIQAKWSFIGDGPVITKDGKAAESNNLLSQDNIGIKIMQKMGWSGGGLGKSQQGIQDPIQAALQIMKRPGFFIANQREFEDKFRKCFKDYLNSDSNNDLVFSPDFTAEERAVLHNLAQSFHLKTQSYGKGNERHLVVSKEMQLPELLRQLLACGGETKKYLLIPPGGHDADSCPSMPSESGVKQEMSDVTPVTSENTKTDLDKVTSVSSDCVKYEQDKCEGTSVPSGVVKDDPNMQEVTSMPSDYVKLERDKCEGTSVPSGIVKDDPNMQEVTSMPSDYVKLERDKCEGTSVPSGIVKSDPDMQVVTSMPSDCIKAEPLSYEITSIYDVFEAESETANDETFDSSIVPRSGSPGTNVNDNIGSNEEVDKEMETEQLPDHSPNINNDFTPVVKNTCDRGPNIAPVDKVLRKENPALATAIENYNIRVTAFYAEGGKFTGKKVRKKYLSWRNKIQKMCGIEKPDLTKVPITSFKLEDVLIDINVALSPEYLLPLELGSTLGLPDPRIANLLTNQVYDSSLGTLQLKNRGGITNWVFGSGLGTQQFVNPGGTRNLPEPTVSDLLKNKFPGINLKKSKSIKVRNKVKAFKKQHYEKVGIERLDQNPYLKCGVISDLAKAEQEAIMAGDKVKAKKYRRQRELEIQRIGGRPCLPKFTSLDIC